MKIDRSKETNIKDTLENDYKIIMELAKKQIKKNAKKYKRNKKREDSQWEYLY